MVKLIRSTKFNLVQRVLELLPRNTYRKLIMLIGFQVVGTLLDILALVLLGLLTKAGIDFVRHDIVVISIPYFDMKSFTTLSAESQFIALSCAIISLFILRTIIALWGNRKILKFLGTQSSLASKRILDKLFGSKPQYVVGRKTQELLYGVTVGIDSLVLSYLGSVVLVLSELFFLVALIVSLLSIQFVAGVCVLIIFGGMGYLIHRFTSKSIRKDSSESGNISVAYNQQLLEVLHIYREHLLRNSFETAITEVQVLRKRYLELRAKFLFLPILSKYLFEFILIFGGATVAIIQFLITDSSTAVSSLVIFLGASSRILPSVVRLQGAFFTLKQSEGVSAITLRQLEEFELNQIQTDMNTAEVILEKSKVKDIVVKGLHFRYPDQSKETLINLTFTVKMGQFVAIVGESGAGKSTLADLLLGIQEPDSGTIEINGITPRAYVAHNPGALSYVPQDISIIDGTILKNVSLSNDATSNIMQVIESLKLASLWDDLISSNMGIESVVGERGMNLSGGQRQRLGIARALYTNPEIIVFDEATSSLDPITEKAVTDSIYGNKENVTLFVIAHRLSTVRKADLVLLLDQGRLIASGTFDEVRRISPKFDQQAKLVNL